MSSTSKATKGNRRTEKVVSRSQEKKGEIHPVHQSTWEFKTESYSPSVSMENFYHKWMLDFVKCLFCIHWYDHMISILHFVYVVIMWSDWQILNHNIIKAIYDKPTANIILNGEKLKGISLRPRTWQVCSLSPILFNMVLEVLITAIIQEKINKWYLNWKGRSKTVVFCRWYREPQRFH